MNDPYAITGGRCLKNKLGISDPGQLREVEGRVVSIREVQLARDTLPGEYNLEHLQAFHQFLFQDIYSWAGRTHTVNISKEGTAFCAWQFVDDEVSAVLARLEKDNWLIGLNREKFVERLAHYYGEINARHPFREGNGRTQRAFLRQLAAAAGWRLDWSALDREDNLAASKENFLTTSTVDTSAGPGRRSNLERARTATWALAHAVNRGYLAAVAGWRLSGQRAHPVARPHDRLRHAIRREPSTPATYAPATDSPAAAARPPAARPAPGFPRTARARRKSGS